MKAWAKKKYFPSSFSLPPEHNGSWDFSISTNKFYFGNHMKKKTCKYEVQRVERNSLLKKYLYLKSHFFTASQLNNIMHYRELFHMIIPHYSENNPAVYLLIPISSYACFVA